MIGNIHGRGEELLAALDQVTVAATAAATFDELTRELEALYQAETVLMPRSYMAAPRQMDPDATVVLSRDDLAAAVLRGAHPAILRATVRRPTLH
ncbi:hypothetical protein Pflav_045270 [Phytohabitans flavus]|uniref:Uncharacterized protein n=2 Tax=Phytohabitans flavus TaxID=1076124 RepID=A0A6F8XWE9_9ACTN|nr:hypothetical protein [Phytohabitans flavus]BCB78117.1 hypothetical protein Pflav_045270 [Phytohabitans flavus]